MQAEQVQAYGAALAQLRQLRQKIFKDCRDVGDNFAKEARKSTMAKLKLGGFMDRPHQKA